MTNIKESRTVFGKWVENKLKWFEHIKIGHVNFIIKRIYHIEMS